MPLGGYWEWPAVASCRVRTWSSWLLRCHTVPYEQVIECGETFSMALGLAERPAHREARQSLPRDRGEGTQCGGFLRVQMLPISRYAA